MRYKLLLLLLLCAVTWPNSTSAQTHAQNGIGLGGLTGAVIGGVIGHQNDEVAEGALIGGAVGAIAGGALGRHRDVYERQAWSHYHAVPARVQPVVPSAVTPNDVIMMTRNGLSDGVIVNHVRTRGMAYSLGTHDIVNLNQQGVSDMVIGAMQTAPVGATMVTRPCQPSTVIVHPHHRTAYPYPVYRSSHHHCRPRCW